MYNLGISKYKLIYEEDYYKNLYTNILSIWKTNGIYKTKDNEYYIDINNKEDIKRINANTLLITSNNNIITKIKKELIQFEDTNNPIFKIIEDTIT